MSPPHGYVLMISNSSSPDALDLTLIAMSTLSFLPNLATFIYFITFTRNLPNVLLSILTGADTLITFAVIVTFILRKTFINGYLSYPLLSSGVVVTIFATTYTSIARCIAIATQFFVISRGIITRIAIVTVVIMVMRVISDNYLMYTVNHGIAIQVYFVWMTVEEIVTVGISFVSSALIAYHLLRKTTQSENESGNGKKRRAAMTVILIGLRTVYCLMTASCVAIMHVSSAEVDKSRYSTVVLLSNSTINPAVQFAVNHELRMAVLRNFKRCIMVCSKEENGHDTTKE